MKISSLSSIVFLSACGTASAKAPANLADGGSYYTVYNYNAIYNPRDVLQTLAGNSINVIYSKCNTFLPADLNSRVCYVVTTIGKFTMVRDEDYLVHITLNRD